jgi:hypothetical protein
MQRYGQHQFCVQRKELFRTAYDSDAIWLSQHEVLIREDKSFYKKGVTTLDVLIAAGYLVLSVEASAAHPRLNFAGTWDIILGRWGGDMWHIIVLDYKSTFAEAWQQCHLL